MYHDNIGLMMGPTVSNSQFELALRRGARAGRRRHVDVRARRCASSCATRPAATWRPNSGSISYTFTAGSDVAPTLPLGRDDPAHIRVMSWNILSDGLWTTSKQPAQNRLLDAIDPDVMVLCEVWNHSAAQTAAQIETFLPSGPGEQWYAAKVDDGNVILSRFPIQQTWLVGSSTSYRETAALIDLGPSQPTGPAVHRLPTCAAAPTMRAARTKPTASSPSSATRARPAAPSTCRQTRPSSWPAT